MSLSVFCRFLGFRACAGYLQHYETLLKELNAHPASDPVPPDQYEVECAALSDRNLNVQGNCYPSLHRIANFGNVLLCTCKCIYVYTTVTAPLAKLAQGESGVPANLIRTAWVQFLPPPA
jgi:hypothetical protein